MIGSLEGRSIKLQVISAKNIRVPSWRIHAGIYVSIKLDSNTRWKSAISAISSDSAVAWGDTLTISPDASLKLSLEIRASFELDRMLGHGALVGKLETSWSDLLNHGDEPFDLSFPPIDDICPSLTLKAAFAHTCEYDDGTLLDSIVECDITRRTDAGYTRFFKYMSSKRGISHLYGAVNYFQWVVARCPVGHPDRAAALTNLAWARLQGYIRKDLQDIDSSISLFRDTLALRPQGHPDHPLSVHRLTEALRWGYKYQRITTNIHECVQLYHELLPICPEGTYLRRIAVGKNGLDYVIRKCNKLPTDASDQGIHFRQIVLELCPLGQPHRPGALRNLSWALCVRFQQSGSIIDIDESIQLSREAVSLCPEGHTGRDDYLNDLAVFLGCRFQHEDESHDLDEAIALYEDVLRLRPVGHKFRDTILDNLGGALVTRFDLDGNVDDINRAISLHREGLTLRRPGRPNRDTILNNLALALNSRYDQLETSKDLNEAINLYRGALQLRQHDHPERHINLFNLSSALCSRFMETQKNEDIEEAISLCQESLAALPALHPDRYFSYDWLRVAYMSRYQILHDPGDLSLGAENFRLASRHPTQGLPRRINVSYDWTVAAEQHAHGSALEAYYTFFELLDAHLATRSSTTSRREAAAAFSYARSLPVDAASCAIHLEDLRQAVKLVEHGRGQQWSLVSRLRTPFEDLESTNPKLARRFSELVRHMSDAQGSTVSTDRAAADQAAREYRKLATEWDTVVAEIRNTCGFSRFLLPPSYKDLQATACHGPVIILIASKYSCNAIIVPTSGKACHVPFADLTLADLNMLKDDFARAIRDASRMGPKESRTDLIVLLQKVWDKIMLPIVNALQYDLKLRRRSRIWLCPTAAFTSIPLHAAHPFRMKADCSGRELCLEDIYVCSYTPTLSALMRSRQAMKTSVTPSFAAIGQSQPGSGQGTVLAAVNSELELVHKLVPPNVKFTSLSGDEATQAGALDALQRNTWVHLACHGKQDRDQPYNSRFSMRDKPLTLLDIMENHTPQAEFAFLSACHTAVGDEETPDEVIHLAAGLQFSGFKSVIGTLWVVDDAVAKHVVEAFYEKMFENLEDGVMDCTRAARALNHATHAVKKKVPLEQRIVFIHIGV